MRGQAGQASVLIVGILMAVVVGAFALGELARALGAHGHGQRAADLGALAGARKMRELYPRLFEPAVIDGVPNPKHLERAAYLAAGRQTAERVALANGARDAVVAFPSADAIAPVVIRVAVVMPAEVRIGGQRRIADVRETADAELVPFAAQQAGIPIGDDYRGPLAYREGKPMRPDVALAFDRLVSAAARDGVHLLVDSGFRSSSEQAVLFAAHPDPEWVARPGTSPHRLGTELDLGPPGAFRWLAANARRFGFIQRYSWEPWHYGYSNNASSSPALANRRANDGDGHSAIPSFVPERYAAPISKAAQRWNVSATLLAAQLMQESKFNPFAQSGAGARGIAQFMPDTAKQYGLSNSFDPLASIDAQAHLMRDLLRQFGSVALALAAYNAGSGKVSACGCVPPIPETLAYVAAILGLMNGSGGTGGPGLEVRLVR